MVSHCPIILCFVIHLRGIWLSQTTISLKSIFKAWLLYSWGLGTQHSELHTHKFLHANFNNLNVAQPICFKLGSVLLLQDSVLTLSRTFGADLPLDSRVEPSTFPYSLCWNAKALKAFLMYLMVTSDSTITRLFMVPIALHLNWYTFCFRLPETIFTQSF
jgi:hypothetical protein